MEMGPLRKQLRLNEQWGDTTAWGSLARAVSCMLREGHVGTPYESDPAESSNGN